MNNPYKIIKTLYFRITITKLYNLKYHDILFIFYVPIVLYERPALMRVIACSKSFTGTVTKSSTNTSLLEVSSRIYNFLPSGFKRSKMSSIYIYINDIEI